METNKTTLFDEEAMLKQESAHVRALRVREHEKVDASDGDRFIGLALSGGGIRSATFNLGLLQALARHGVLSHFDYLSTVSGGGYIGAWLSALIYRRGSRSDVERLLTERQDDNDEAPPLRFLRRYSSYLTPRTGLSGDTLAALSTYLRNFFLNQVTLISFGCALIFAVYLLARGAQWINAGSVAGHPALPDESWLSFALILLAVWAASIGLATTYEPAPKSMFAQPSWAWAILIPACSGGLLIALIMMRDSGSMAILSRQDWIIFSTIAYGITWISGFVIWNLYSNREETAFASSYDRVLSLIMTLLVGAVAGLLLSSVSETVRSPPGIDAKTLAHAWWTIGLGAPLVMLSFSGVVALHIGLLSRLLSHEAREWWSRLGGLMLIAVFLWGIAFAIVGLSPALVLWSKGWIVEAGGVWATLTLLGVWLAKSPLTGGPKSHRGLEIAVRATPYIFLLGLAIALSASTYFVFSENSCPNCSDVKPTETLASAVPCSICIETHEVARDFPNIAQDVFDNMAHFDPASLLLALAVCISIFMISAWRIDINLFSLHHFYRNRLVRAYLGASNYPDRKSHPFTGFCVYDDLPLSYLRNQRPFHIINAALNLSGGKELAWQTRRAASFVFTPLHCGFAYRATRASTKDEEQKQPHDGYRPTEHYQSPHGSFLGSAMSISGAAASPLSGYHTSAAMAALMTIFNVRLGQWLGNPIDIDAWQHSSPRFGALYLFKELSATADTHARFLYLSDGGHFENLGLYELVRRKCRLIVVSDAGCDPNYAFDDLANAQRKCSIDLGAEIDINIQDMRPEDGFKHTQAHHAIGSIRYADGSRGTLLYLKASLTDGEAPDIINYATNHPDFPHDTTADQSFDEDQFESYRKLGQHIGELFGEIRELVESHEHFTPAAFAEQVDNMAIAPRVISKGA